jgi:hypothetical protein
MKQHEKFKMKKSRNRSRGCFWRGSLGWAEWVW